MPNPTPAWLEPYLSILGLYVSGDLGGFTIYTTRKGRVVLYPESPANKPPSYLQTQQRSRFRQAQNAWRKRSIPEQAAWELAVNRLGLDLTGQNAVISLGLTPDDDAFNRLNAAVNGVLTPVTAVPR